MADVDIRQYFNRAADWWDSNLQTVGEEQWSSPTPCTEWNVRALVNHICSEEKWMPPLLAGKTIADVGDAFDGDLLGDDPKGNAAAALNEARDAVQEEGAMERTVHLSFGDFPGEEYTFQVMMDLFVHGWDLARAIGADDEMDRELVEYTYRRIQPTAEAWRGSGVFAAKLETPEDADPQTKLLALLGRKR